jgi:hypothetical protein
MSRESFVFLGFSNGANQHTWNIDFVSWVIYSPVGQLVTLGGTFLGPSTINVVKYSVVIKLLHDVIAHGIQSLEVYFDAQLVVSQKNGEFHICDPMLHHCFLRLCLLEHYFDYITYIHVSRSYNALSDAFVNYVLD